ncbi:hypothetical protein SCLCIDRAFT_1157353 [Scleroderma citrinum Foug A]|uniref:SET domain-containing protein n=1 Tax=Scleroderma citrinum Foug A TaxID=1036808 RepID=A0A0C3DB96_9AGAM|nr:hypothetical protein SCLCIDRAFT_1157353 [Scleroderma citrinum Foug A]
MTYSPNGEIESETSTPLQVINLIPDLTPHPPYESCAPISRNLFRGDDADAMAFVPYADDPLFNQIDHTLCYGSFSWQEEFDPDLEVIVLEAAYRLNTQHALTYEEIEKCNALPLTLASRPGESGLLSGSQRRDLLDWSGNSIPADYVFPSLNSTPASNSRHRVRSVNSLFCPNLNCVELLCGVHAELNAMPLSKKLPKPLHQILDDVKLPCINRCFLGAEETQVCDQCAMSFACSVVASQELPCWSDDDIESFRVIFEIAPDLSPCGLAVLCLKPCCEVTAQCINPYSHDPCRHSGPCGTADNCPCVQSRSRCQRNCHCPPKCTRRWRGCRCSKENTDSCCTSKKCPCVESLIECDPELCLTYENTMCKNSQIQKCAHKGLEVKSSRWGIGAFLTEPASANDLISGAPALAFRYSTSVSLYTNLLLTVAGNEVAAHRGRSYTFALNNMLSLDASYIGDSSRFINHSGSVDQTNGPNCRAYVRLVNGEHRIGIYAARDLEAGSEILLDYGHAFFSK